MEFNTGEFKLFRADVENALKEVAKKHNVEITTGKITYSTYEFSMKLDVKKADEGIDIEKDNFTKHCTYYGFSPDDYKLEFSLNNKRFQLVGFNVRSPKNCCSIYCVTDGRTYKCSDEAVKNAINSQYKKLGM